MTEQAPVQTKQRMTKSQKDEALALWAAGMHSADEIARKVGVKEATLKSLFVRRKAKKGEKHAKVEERKEALIHEALALDPAVHARRVFDTKNETYRIAEMLRKLTAKVIVEAQQQNKPIGSVANDIKTLREAAMTIGKCREEAFAVLGITDEKVNDDDLPPLQILGLTDEQMQDLQDQPIQMPDMPDTAMPSDD
jgi:hypothetical protein